MSDVFIQTNVTLSLDTNIDLSGATTTEIHYTKPDGTYGEWTASINGQNIEYKLADDDIEVEGEWKFQAYVAFGSDDFKGKIVKQYFLTPIKLT